MIKKNGGIFGRNPTYNDVVVEGVLTLKEAQVFDNDITINGDLTVNGTETVINTVELNVDDKNITMGAVVAKVGLAATTNITAGQFTVQLADTSGLIPGMTVTKTSGTGAFGASPKIASVDSHTQITLTVAHATSGTIIFDTGGATDDTADGGGITLKGLTDKFIKWVKSTAAWTFSDKIEAPDVTITNLTASQSVFTDANKKLVSADATTARSNLGLGTMATQAANNVAITGGSIAGITDLAVADGGTGASDAATARTNLGLGTMATQAANNVAITGGAIDGATVGATTAAAGKFTTLQAAGDMTVTLAGKYIKNNASNTDTTAFLSNSTGTGANFLQLINGGGTYTIGMENSSSTYWGTPAYSLTLSMPSTRKLAVFAGGVGTLLTADAVTQDVTVNMGNLVIGTSGKGIDFSATSQASGMTSELLSDYEEGTWTPSDQSGAGLTFTTVDGYYTKIGRMVYASFWVTYPSTADTANNAIGGLPYTAANTNAARGGSALTYSEFNAVSSIYGPKNNTLFSVTDGVGNSRTNATMSGKTIMGCIVYFT